jgi:hypothetical protein
MPECFYRACPNVPLFGFRVSRDYKGGTFIGHPQNGFPPGARGNDDRKIEDLCQRMNIAAMIAAKNMKSFTK